MPTYGYRCDPCEVDFDVTKPMAEFDSPETCPSCEGGARRLFEPCGYVLKGDDWAGKNLRVSRQMQQRREAAGRRQEVRRRDSNVGGRLVPNVGGERVDTWTEAGKLAGSQGKDTTGYEAQVQKEERDSHALKSTTSKSA